MKQARAPLTLMLAIVAGCSFHARSPDDYRQATRALLDERSGGVEGCYRRALTADQNAQGTVVVRFEVEAKTGNIVNAKVVDEKTTAKQELRTCVIDALDGLTLDPPDQRTGEATFEWEFGRASS